MATRPFLEEHIRAQVKALDNVAFLGGREAVGLTACATGHRITGVRITPPGCNQPEVLDANLVVDARGRGGRPGAWLAEYGYARPKEERIQVNVTYASRHYALPIDALGNDRAVAIAARPGCPKGLGFSAQENGKWVLSLYGYGNHIPPRDPDGFLRFAQSVAPQDVIAAIGHAEPIDDITMFRFPAGSRKRYEKISVFPQGFLAVGDALCSLNPIYGQGITSAAAQTLALDRCLDHGTDRLAQRFFPQAANIAKTAWWLAASADYALPEVAGRYALAMVPVSRYLARLMAAAEHDPQIATNVIGAIGLATSPLTLIRPSAMLAAFAGRDRHGTYQGSRASQT
ncbi:NAD(P)/FAD-dependent oxidoreductase [Streptomyces sp. NPDC001719]